MADNPFIPDDWKANTGFGPNEICKALRYGVLRRAQMKYLWLKWAFNADGTVSSDFAQYVCAGLAAIGCSNGGTTTTTVGTGTTLPTTSTTTLAPTTVPVYAVTDLNNLVTIDLQTGAVNLVIALADVFVGLAMHPTTHVLYGVIESGADYQLVVFNMFDFSYANSGSVFTERMVGLAFNTGGTLMYGCEGGETAGVVDVPGYLWKITTGGVDTVIGSGLNPFNGNWVYDVQFAGGTTLYGVGRYGSNLNTALFFINVSTGITSSQFLLSPPETSSGNDCLCYYGGQMFRIKGNNITRLEVTGGGTGEGSVTGGLLYNVSNGIITNMAHLQ